MIIGIVGSRKFPRLEDVVKFVKLLPTGTTIVTGGAAGVDKKAELTGIERGLHVIVHYPDYAKYGDAATHVRNDLIIKDSEDGVYAFWDGVSPGTRSVISKCKKRGVKVEVVT